MKILFSLISLLAIILTGCKTQQQTPKTLPAVVLNNSDSVRVKTIIKTIYVPVEVTADLPQQTASNVTPDDSSHVETDLAYSDAWVENGILHHHIRNKTGQLKGEAFVPQTTEHTTSEAVKIKEVPVPEPYPVEVEREFTLMEQIKLAAFWYLVGLVAVVILFIIRKPFLMILRKIIRL